MRTAGYDGATEASVQQSAAEGALHDPRGMTLPDVGWPAASAVSRVIRGHDARVPGVDSMEAFLQAAAEFAVADLELQAEPSAAAAAQQSLDESGLLLLGEVHGVRENPLLVRALMRMFGLTSLALEWPVTWRLRWRPSWPGTRLPIIRSCGSAMGGSRPGTWRSWPNAPGPGRWS